MSQAARLRTLLASGKMIVAPGAIDGITGNAIDRAGFSAAYMTGAGTSATLGYPDYGTPRRPRPSWRRPAPRWSPMRPGS